MSGRISFCHALFERAAARRCAVRPTTDRGHDGARSMIADTPQHDYCPIVFIRRDGAVCRLKAWCRYVNSVLITAGCDDVPGLEAPVLHHAVFEPARVRAPLKLYRCVRHRPPGLIDNAAPHANATVAAQPECRSGHRYDEQYEATVHGVPSYRARCRFRARQTRDANRTSPVPPANSPGSADLQHDVGARRLRPSKDPTRDEWSKTYLRNSASLLHCVGDHSCGGLRCLTQCGSAAAAEPVRVINVVGRGRRLVQALLDRSPKVFLCLRWPGSIWLVGRPQEPSQAFTRSAPPTRTRVGHAFPK